MIKIYLTGIVYKLLWVITMPLLRRKYNPVIINSEVIPKRDPVIFCGNHRHKMDQYFIIMSTFRVIHWVVKEDYFNGKDNLFGDPSPLGCRLTTIFLKIIGSIRVDRRGFVKQTIRETHQYLKLGRCVGIFPEGTRNKSKELLLPFYKGAVMLAKKADAWIQPVAITGLYLPNSLTVSFGTPFKVENLSLDEANELLRYSILSGIEDNLVIAQRRKMDSLHKSLNNDEQIQV